MTQESGQNVSDDRPGPLNGRVVAVTRPEPRGRAMSLRLRELGAEVLECPAIRLRDPDDLRPLRRAASRLEDGGYDWLVFTSPAGVHQLCRVLSDGKAPELPDTEGLRGAAIGSSTAESAREAGFRVDVVPEEYRAEALADGIIRAAATPSGRATSGGAMAGLRVLLPRAAEARAVLPQRLEAAGAAVDEVPAYKAVRPDEEEMAELREAVARGDVDWLTFTASSIVRSYVERVGTKTAGARVAAIGPITAETARNLGLRVDVVAEQYTADGLVEALARAEEFSRPQETR